MAMISLSDMHEYFKGLSGDFQKLLTRLVMQPSFSGDKRSLNLFADMLQELFAIFPLDRERIPTQQGDVLIFNTARQTTAPIAFLGHMDTVKVNEDAPAVRIEQNRFYGCGCYDMKSGIALFYFVLRALRDLNLPTTHPIRLIFNPDEETGSQASWPILLQHCTGAEAVLLPEPCLSDGGVKMQRKGIAEVRAFVSGEAAHSGIEPEKGRDANRGLLQLIRQIDSVVHRLEDVTFNPGVISGGVAANIVSPECYLEGEIRSYDNAKITTAMMEISAITIVNKMPADVSVKILHPALEINPANQKLYKKANAIATALHYTLPAGSSGGASDGSSLAHAGIPVLDGIGLKGDGAHRPNEFVELDDFPFRATLLTALYLEISGHGRNQKNN